MIEADNALEIFRVLVVDDEVLYARAIGRALGRKGIQCDLVHCAHDALARAATGQYQVILLDHMLPDGDGISLIPTILSRLKSASIIVMTAFEAIPNAIAAIRNGAEDYQVKQTSIVPLVDAVLEIRHRREAYAGSSGVRTGLTGRSPVMCKVAEQIERVASGRTTVLLTGETGSGKEVAAREIHRLSGRQDKPFVAVDCTSLPSQLIESLLFGHEKGAFTGADQMRKGAFQEAGEGTIFLDEIGDMPLELQVRLLRVIESRTFKRLGSVKEHPVEARVIAATNRDLALEVDAGRFRFDLFQRLAVFPIYLPPLRDRGDDVLLLAGQFLEEICRTMNVSARTFSREVELRLMDYDFPGNVRELKNIIERAVILTDGDIIEPMHLPERMLNPYRDLLPSIEPALITSFSASEGQDSSGVVPLGFAPGLDTLEGLEEKLIRLVLERAGGNKSEAARLLGISRFSLLRRLEKLGREQ
jgi:two-component system NtrC family response regulator